jgi:MarR family transcriptional regulator, transcriptional regulator for hemolysin
MEKLKDILFYSLERSIKSYRQFAHRQFAEHGFDITIDQWLILKALHEDPGQTQSQIADTVFKDYASVTRIIELLVEKKHLIRSTHPHDRRRFSLELTKDSIRLLKEMQPLIDNNRSIALAGIGEKQVSQLQSILNQIIKNCQTPTL